ncbi:MAG: CGNR zinc finger domain-containing protein [Bryobacteraceae bacterium]|jgi:predicted RNA-binding Zn ribbon-like protein
MATPEQRIPEPFELVAGHIALDLVNSLDNRFYEVGPEELLASYDDVLRFASQSGLLTARQAKKLKSLDASEGERAEVLRQVKELREALATIAYAQVSQKNLSASALVTLEDYFRQAGFHRHLVPNNLRPVWRWRGLDCQLAAPVWLLAQQTEDFLLSDRTSQLRSCASDTCRWLFLDASKNHSRRWCDMRVCGNRMKARRFHARKSD